MKLGFKVPVVWYRFAVPYRPDDTLFDAQHYRLVGKCRNVRFLHLPFPTARRVHTYRIDVHTGPGSRDIIRQLCAHLRIPVPPQPMKHIMCFAWTNQWYWLSKPAIRRHMNIFYPQLVHLVVQDWQIACDVVSQYVSDQCYPSSTTSET